MHQLPKLARGVRFPLPAPALPSLKSPCHLDKTQEIQDVFDHVEMLYNPVRKLVRNGMLSPLAFERQQILKAGSVWKTRRYSG